MTVFLLDLPMFHFEEGIDGVAAIEEARSRIISREAE